VLGPLALVAALLALPGCYSARTRMPERLQTIAVPVFANRTYLEDYTRGLEMELTEATRQVFLQNGRLKLTGRENADLVLEGDVLRFQRSNLRVDRYGDPAEVQLDILARVSLYDVKEARYLFRNMSVTNQKSRPSSGVYNLRRGESEAMGRKQAIEDLGRNISRLVLERW
jgi:hypothetical protein